jgi:hypothetical protein
MSTKPRQPRRQGVVYGPVALRDQREPGSVIGRLLGAIVVFGALAVLAIGALAVIGGGNEVRPTATPTLVAGASPTPTASVLPTLEPTPTPTPTPTLLLTLPPTFVPTPTPFLVELVQGPGKITFASDYTGGLTLINPHVEFKLSDQMAWKANIGQPVGRVRVDFDVYRVNTTTMAETNVHTASFVGTNPDARLYYAKAPVSREVDGPGVFVMRYAVDGTTISEGYFRVTQ